MPVYTGTAREQWAEAGIDAELGKITAVELHALGERLFRIFDEAEEQRREQRGLVSEVIERASDLGSDLLDALHAVEGLEELKKRIAELEGRRV